MRLAPKRLGWAFVVVCAICWLTVDAAPQTAGQPTRRSAKPDVTSRAPMSETTLGILATILGSAATAVGVLTAWLTSRAAAQAALQQSRIAAHSAAAEWLRDVRAWAAEAIAVLSEAYYTCQQHRGKQMPDDAAAVLRSCRHRISTLIDHGRFFFPNQNPNEDGTDKLPAFRGYRHAVLDPLVAAERVLGGNLGGFSSSDDALLAMRRHFVNRVQQVLSPQTHNRQIAQMIQESSDARASDPRLGGLLPDSSDVPSGADALLHSRSTKLRPDGDDPSGAAPVSAP